MLEKSVILSIIFFVTTCLVPIDTRSEPIINLNKSGVLKRIQNENPEHYKKIQEILKGIYKQPEIKVPYWLITKFNARYVLYGPALLTSLPPKKHISFTLDSTRYEALLTLTNFGPQI